MTLYIIAGANGSGKTTFAKSFSNIHNMHFINADEIAKELDPQILPSIKLKQVEFFLRSFIMSISLNLDVESHILGFQSLFDNYKKPKYRVEILVSPQQAKYFKDKKWLKSQKILSDDNEGLLIEYQINNDMEILPLVKKWLPDIEIISPKKLRDRLYRDIDKFLSKRG